MFYKSYEELTIVQVSEQTESVSFDALAEAILERPSNMIYCEADGKLIGIISTGDIKRACLGGLSAVSVNRSFTRVTKKEYIKAREIFLKKDSMNALPVVNDAGDLTGDYSRWNDRLKLKHLFDSGIDCGKLLREREERDKPLVLVRPCRDFPWKQECFEKLCRYLKCLNMPFQTAGYRELDKYRDAGPILFVDRDERNAIWAFWAFLSADKFIGRSFLSYNDYFYDHAYGFDFEKLTAYLKKLNNDGTPVFNLYFPETDFFVRLKKRQRDKFDGLGLPHEYLPKEQWSEFYDDLYSEEYAKEMQKITYGVEGPAGMLKDCKSEYYNAADGERHTKGQPGTDCSTVYFFGPCLIYGYYVEDRYTIESFLQKRLNDSGCKARVVNCGSPGYGNWTKLLYRMSTTHFKKKDLIVVYFCNKIIGGINNIDLMDALEKHDAPSGWFADNPWHCNHKANSLYADAIFDAMQPTLGELADTRENQGRADKEAGKTRTGSFNPYGKLNGQEDFVKVLYIDRYFANFNTQKYTTIGSIVMNCNPFTYGHRYLMEQALAQVDFLIVFVVEEDKSIFSFDERFACVCEGAADLENVKIVPSGPFILSQTSFPEYFIKEADENVAKNAENDIRFFAEHIAPYLHITHRFVGEEPEDAVTNEYNLAMKRILPKYGIKLAEIPRREQNGAYISASRVRRCLADYDMEGLKELVPESTMRTLGLAL